MAPAPEDLLVHAGWLRRLAQSLVGAGGGADDLVQETWIAALRHPPRTDLPLRPWLAQVLRNLVRMRRRHSGVQAAKRDEIVRSEKERSAPSSPEALLGRLESERLLARLVAELAEPYRQTVLLRYFEGRSSAEIARVLGIPAATVRWRLKTGVDRLRAELDAANHGDRRAWRLALLPLAMTAPPARGGLLTKGLWLMTRTQKTGAAIAAVLALAALLFVAARQLGDGRGAGATHKDETKGGSARSGEIAAATAPSAKPSGSAAAGVSLTPGGGARVVHEPALQNGGFAGRVLNWSTGEGVAKAQVTFAGDGGATLSAETDAAGRFELEAPAPGRYVLAVASATGFLPFAPEWGHSPIALIARPGLRIAEVTLFLRPAIDYTGVVEDPRGRPVGGATVRLLEVGIGEQALSPLADRYTTDERGEFVFHAPDETLLEARHPSYGVGRASLDGPALVSHRLVIRLPAKRAADSQLGAASVSGRVVDEHGAAIAAALVRAAHGDLDGLHPHAEIRAGDDGRFVLGGLDPGLHDVWAVCDGCASAHAKVMSGGDVTLTVAVGGVIAGRVVDAADGQPVPAFTVVVSRPRGLTDTLIDQATVLDAEGRFEVRGLEAGDYRVRAIAEGHAPSPPENARAGAAGDEPEEIVLRLTRGGTLFGSVVDRADGKPLSWARVTVEGTTGDGSSAVPLSVSTVTDEKGEFTLGGVPPGMRSVVAAAYAHNMSMTSGLRVEEGARLGPLAFRLRATKEGEEPKLELFGIGAKLRAEVDAILVDGVIDGGGAALAGLLAGDGIVKVDGQLVTDLGFADAIQRIRGPEGTFVMLGVRRPNRGGQVIDVSVERRPIQF